MDAAQGSIEIGHDIGPAVATANGVDPAVMPTQGEGGQTPSESRVQVPPGKQPMAISLRDEKNRRDVVAPSNVNQGGTLAVNQLTANLQQASFFNNNSIGGNVSFSVTYNNDREKKVEEEGGGDVDEEDGVPAEERVWKKVLRSYTEDIVEKVDVRNVISYLIGKDVLDEKEKQNIFAIRTKHGQAATLLDIVLTKGQSGMEYFVKSLERRDYAALSTNLREYYNKLIDPETAQTAVPVPCASTEEIAWRKVLRKHREVLLGTVSVDEIIPELYAGNAMNQLEEDDIFETPTSHAKTAKLIDVITAKGLFAIQLFVNSLQKSYAFLVPSLTASFTEEMERVE